MLTKQDLHEFKQELFHELKSLNQTRRWLRSYEVRKLLNISPGTLQSLRLKNILHPKKIGTLLFFDHEEITTLLNAPDNNSKTHNS